MPRQAKHSKTELVERALCQFWQSGFFASSMDDLVRETGVSRHGIYSAFGGKDDLFLACFEVYQDQVVTPAFAQVEAANANLTAVRAYFEQQLQRAETNGLPGPGCFVANSATEVGPTMPAAHTQIGLHHARLRRGFRNALRNAAESDETSIQNLSDVMVVFTNGFWSMSRTTDDADALRRYVRTFLNMIEEQIS